MKVINSHRQVNLLPQTIPPTPTRRIKVRSLSQRDHSISLSRERPVVLSHAVEGRPEPKKPAIEPRRVRQGRKGSKIRKKAGRGRERQSDSDSPVVPNRDRSNLPFEPDLEIVVLADVLEEVGEKMVGLVEGELVDSFGEAERDEGETRRDVSLSSRGRPR